MALPSTALGATVVANDALAKLKAGMAAAVADVNAGLASLGETLVVVAPSDDQIKMGRRVDGWPSALPALRVFVANTSFGTPAGGLGLVDVTHTLVVRVFYEDVTDASTIADELDAQTVETSAFCLADACRAIIERDLERKATGVFGVQSAGIAPFDAATRKDNTSHLVKVLDLSIAVTQRCRQHYV